MDKVTGGAEGVGVEAEEAVRADFAEDSAEADGVEQPPFLYAALAAQHFWF